MPDQTQLTTWYTEHAVKFIAENKAKPFFLYVPHSMPHVRCMFPRSSREEQAGLYADVIMEITGASAKSWRSQGTAWTRTRWSSFPATTALAQLRQPRRFGGRCEGKDDLGKGASGSRAWSAGRGRFRRLGLQGIASTMDIAPHVRKLAGSSGPSDRIIDGHDIWPLLSGRRTRSRPPTISTTAGTTASTVAPANGARFPHKFNSLTAPPAKDGQPGDIRGPLPNVFDLEACRRNQERRWRHPDIVIKLQKVAAEAPGGWETPIRKWERIGGRRKLGE